MRHVTAQQRKFAAGSTKDTPRPVPKGHQKTAKGRANAAGHPHKNLGAYLHDCK